jgi:hypothetical protein
MILDKRVSLLVGLPAVYYKYSPSLAGKSVGRAVTAQLWLPDDQRDLGALARSTT